jgi:hypothetical protein
MFQKLLCHLKIHKKGNLEEKFYIDTYDYIDIWKSILYERYKCSCCGEYFDVRIGELPPHEKYKYQSRIYTL